MPHGNLIAARPSARRHSPGAGRLIHVMKTVRVIVSGKVQGVGYRFFVVDAATRLGIAGYTRNMESRHLVEVVAAGADEQIERLLALLHVGPGGAHVASVEMTELQNAPPYDSFTIEP
jgi:acylphosphatase